ncbi:hypothetical protein ABZ543_35405 [Streptomyces roseifaciens]
MKITLGLQTGEGRGVGLVVDGPVLIPHSAGTMARSFRATSFVAKLGDHDGCHTVLWIQLTGAVLTDETSQGSMAFHLPLLPQQERVRARIWEEVLDEVKELANLALETRL